MHWRLKHRFDNLPIISNWYYQSYNMLRLTNSSSRYARDQGKVMISWIHLVMKLILLWNDPITYWHVQLYKIWGYEILITKLHIPRISSPKISVEHCPYSMPCGGVHQMRLYNSWSKGTKQFIPIKSSILDENGWYTLGQACVLLNILWRFVRVQETRRTLSLPMHEAFGRE